MNMPVGRMVELAAAVLMLVGGVYFYRRPKGADSTTDGSSYGSQGAVILFVVAAIMGIHAVGGLDYHPSAGELDAMKGQRR